jgi:hypothetical protein
VRNSKSELINEGLFNYFVLLAESKSNLKKSVVLFDREETFCVGPVPSLKHSRIASLPKLT